MSYRTIPVITLPKNPGIDQQIVVIIVAPQTLLMPGNNKIVAVTASGGAWIYRTLRQVSKTGVDGSTLGNIHNDIGIVETSSLFLIGLNGTTAPCCLNLSQEVGDI